MGTDFDCDGGLIAGALQERDYKGSDSSTKPGHLLPINARAVTRRNGGSGGAERDGGDTLIAFSAKDHGGDVSDISPTLRAGPHDKSHANAGVMPAIAFDYKASASHSLNPSDITPSLSVGRADGLTVAHSLRADGFDAGEDGTGRGTPLVIHALDAHSAGRATEDGTGRGVPLTLAIRGRGGSHDLEYRDDGVANAVLTPNGGRGGIGVGAVALPIQSVQAVREKRQNGIGIGDDGGEMFTLTKRDQHAVAWSGCLQHKGLAATGNEAGTLLQNAMSVRRLTPRECERLQGFPDDWTAITYRGKPAADGPRYRALGNSMAVPVLRWILQRLRAIDAMPP